MKSLAEQFNISHRIVTSTFKRASDLLPIDYAMINQELEENRALSLSFLINSMQ